MRQALVWLSTLAFAGLLVTAGIYASNLGFKGTVLLTGAGGLANGTNAFALPYSTSLTTAKELCDDLEANGCAINFIARYSKSADGYPPYDCMNSANNFNIAPGDCYQVQVASDCSYTLAGASDSNSVLSLTDEVGPGNTNGTNSIALPYSTTAVTANDICDQVAAAGTTVNFVARYVKSSDGYPTYNCPGINATDFDVVPGECYQVQVNDNVTFTPPSY